MEVHRQRCQNCQSIDLRNILVREPGLPAVVYVRCAACRELVARYELSEYYHHGKGVESYLKSVGTSANDSGRAVLRDFERVKTESTEGYARAILELERQGKDV